ncbi:pancreatic triacylglycerol lipase-like [Neodiprion virginianus]|uniref:pancreatic triacylglycerol lipase-like n=1 Tax=Neodiprion virginianus TaxID=2961670 RepID=UPI001EE6E4AB|nr:pancreatic triacylglycerol lipase-like [Neodiprion virginianus]
MQSTWLLYFCLPLVAAVSNCSYTPCDDCTIRATPSELANISLRFYTGTTLDNYVEELVGNAVNLLNYLNSSKPTLLYISGWTETPESNSVISVLGAYSKRNDHNVILANYEDIATRSYPFAALSVPGVGYTLAQAFNELVENALDSSTLHVVSHSLGSQISGFFGKCASFSVPRITGLDPAGPGFNLLIENLGSGDAEFIDIIHTDAGVYGTIISSGDVNFFPNGGTRLQPGCNLSVPFSDDDFCSHHRSWQYFTESLESEDAFVGRECSSYSNFTSGLCDSNTTIVMGFATPTTATGKFYLQTNGASPYGRENAGLTYDSSI